MWEIPYINKGIKGWSVCCTRSGPRHFHSVFLGAFDVPSQKEALREWNAQVQDQLTLRRELHADKDKKHGLPVAVMEGDE